MAESTSINLSGTPSRIIRQLANERDRVDAKLLDKYDEISFVICSAIQQISESIEIDILLSLSDNGSTQSSEFTIKIRPENKIPIENYYAYSRYDLMNFVIAIAWLVFLILCLSGGSM